MVKETQLLADLIVLSEEGEGLPLHQQIYKKIRKAIIEGVLPSDSRLPSSRGLANSLKLSRNTVTAAYEQLIAEGFLATRQGAGTYVKYLDLLEPKDKSIALPKESNLPLNITKRLRTLIPAEQNNFSLQGKRLMPGLVDLELFPYRQWNSLYKQYSNNIDDILPQVDLHNGYSPLRQALSSHLAVTRGVNAQPEQIFITGGMPQSLALIARTLTDPKDCVWMEEPGYFIAADSLASSGLTLEPAAVDQYGLNPLCKKLLGTTPRLIYATTSYQFPLGFTMPIKRRLELLDIAEQKQAWIIEDDYDGEFRYKGSPIPSLFSLENNNRTIYTGTFSKTLSLELRMSYIVVPLRLVPYFQCVYPAFGNLSSMVTQAVLSEFISRGLLARHIEKMRKTYAGRRHALEQALVKHCGVTSKVEAFNPGGLHITMELEAAMADMHMIKHVSQSGIGCLPLSMHYRANKEKKSGLLLGFTSCDEKTIEESIIELQKVIAQNHGKLKHVALGK